VKPRVVVIGAGNRYQRDDAAGLAVAERLRELAPDGVSVLEAEGEGTALIELWRGADAAIIVDAVRAASSPGTLHRLEAHAGPVSAGLFPASSHAVSIADAVELARALGELPPRLVLIGIEAGSVEAGVGLTAPVERAVGRAVETVLREIESLNAASRA
jgi:hydrogenase maturation protease